MCSRIVCAGHVFGARSEGFLTDGAFFQHVKTGVESVIWTAFVPRSEVCRSAWLLGIEGWHEGDAADAWGCVEGYGGRLLRGSSRLGAPEPLSLPSYRSFGGLQKQPQLSTGFQASLQTYRLFCEVRVPLKFKL